MARLNLPLVALIPLAALAACGGPRGMEPLTPDGVPPDCDTETYPAGAVEPMALGDTLTPYAWPESQHLGTGQRADLDLGQVPCNLDDDIDWSPFDVLVFISVPAW